MVTAQKRAENVQAVPISINALSGATLAKSGVTNIDDLQHFAPGLTISAVGAGFVSYTYLRGGGTNQIDAGSDPSVAYFVDEVYIGGTAGLQFDLFDIDHVEVLKGPQGALFGRNAASGAISVTTKRPSPVFGGTLDAEVGDYGDYTARVGVTGPLDKDDHWLYRLALGYRHRDGFTKNLAGGPDPGRIESYGGRAQIEYVGDTVTFLLTADGLQARDGMTNQFIASANKSGLLSPAAIAALPPGESFYKHYYNVDGFEHQTLGDLTGRLEWKTPVGTITSITALRSNLFDRLQDQDATIADSYVLATHERDETFSQEVRLAGQAARWRWIGGFYYYHGRVTDNWVLKAGPAFPTAVVENHTATDDSVITSDAYALFGQATYDFTDQLSLTAGGRYSIDDKRDQREVKGFLAASPFSVDPHAQWSSFDPSASLNFKLTPDILTYVSYRQGYKSGGFQTLLPSTAAVANKPFQPENVKAYEVGLKSEWFDHRLLADIAVFRQDITNQQILRITGPALQTIDNAGATRADGVDVTLSAKPVHGLSLDASMTYQKARFLKYQNGAASYAGREQLRSPDFTGSYSAEYDFDLPQGAGLAVRAEYTYQAQEFFDAANTRTAGLYQPGYGLANARVTYTPARGDWSVAFWGKNLGDTHYYRNIAVASGTGLAVPGDPMTYGATLNVKFH
ncbi:MAG: TonB-dependent receptor [Caulobacteraceae bacterium]|nr:TonB-dependent receptor [Caulobacteraceae bacterium]